MDLNNKHLSNFELKFKNPNLNFENKLNTSAKNKKIGSLRTTFLNYKIDTDYFYNDKLIKFIPKKWQEEQLFVQEFNLRKSLNLLHPCY